MQPWQWLLSSMVLSSTTLGLPGAAQPDPSPPGVYYSWRVLDAPTEQCLERSQQALTTAALGEIQQVDNSVAGRTQDTTVVVVCLPNQQEPSGSTVMVIVAGPDDQAALDLRAALQAAF